jgi:hypothetical protein
METIAKRVTKLERAMKELAAQPRIDPDRILTEDDYRAIEEYRKERDAGKLVSLSTVKRRLKLA